ncbi:MAG: NAD(+) diphosphatase [Lentisphaeria bacterium]
MAENWHFKVETYSEFRCSPADPCVVFNPAGEVVLNGATGEVLHLEGYQRLLGGDPQDAAYLGTWDGRRCYAVTLSEQNAGSFVNPISLREILAQQKPEEGCLACMGKQLLFWRQQTRFCSACATPLQEKTGERARICPQCQTLYYPRINPAVIVAIRRGEKILLAHNRNFAGGIFSLVAGYVEVGESLEQAVEREVLEEVGIRIRNLRYWGSQAWPFPSSLMMGFLAEYESGELQPDGTEIDLADWFALSELPPLPRAGSISRRIIESLLPEKQAVIH